MLFVTTQKPFSLSRYLSFCHDFSLMYRNGLIKKVNLKFYDVTAWLANYFHAHIAKYLEK